MKNEGRYLILTADEDTWKFGQPVIFLGEWCRRFDRRHIWRDMNAIVAKPYGLSVSQKDADEAQARIIENKILTYLCNTLNRVHNLEYDKRFWQIILGHWLRRYVNILLNRVKTLEQCFCSHKISGVTFRYDENYSLSTLGSGELSYAANDVIWNGELTRLILRLINDLAFPINIVHKASHDFQFKVREKSAVTAVGWLKRCTRFIVSRSLGVFARRSDAFILSSYLPKIEEFKLQLSIGQCPQLWESPKLDTAKKVDKNLRALLRNEITNAGGAENQLEQIIFALLFEALPMNFLEAFSDINKFVESLPWPSNPKFVMTANNFDSDDIFKVWLVKKIKKGTKYFVSQHGSNYGTARLSHTVEEITADKFLTWGWVDGLEQHTPMFINKIVGKRPIAGNLNGGLLLVEVHLPNRINTHDSTYEFVRYFDEQIAFVDGLPKNIKDVLTIKLHSEYRRLDWSEGARWYNLDKTLRVDGQKHFSEMITQNRLLIFSYDSTGLLEALAQNYPTLAFWQGGLGHLRESAKPYYQFLVDAGLIHFHPESILKKIDEVWDNIEGWWSSDIVQHARYNLCEKYAKVSEQPILDIKTFLQDATVYS